MKGKNTLLLAAIWLTLFCLMELGSWAMLKISLTRQPSNNPLVNEYIRRGHPLLADNDDLRRANLEFRFHPYLGFTLVPDKTYVRPHHGYETRIETDALGFVHNGDKGRNPAALSAPPNGTYRILFLGGSTMFGLGASGNRTTIPAQFEQKLHQLCSNIDFLVINGGVMAYQSTQERLAYELYLADQVKPDAVIALDGLNDALIAGDMKDWQPHASQALLVKPEDYVGLFRPATALAAYAKNLLSFPEPLYSLALLRRAMSRLTPAIANDPRKVADYHPEAAGQLVANLEALAGRLEREGRLGLFVLQPYLGAAKNHPSEVERDILKGYGDRTAVYNRYFTDFADRYIQLDGAHRPSGIQFMDLRHVFRDDPNHVYESIAHYNDYGNRVIAEVLADHFSRILVSAKRCR